MSNEGNKIEISEEKLTKLLSYFYNQGYCEGVNDVLISLEEVQKRSRNMVDMLDLSSKNDFKDFLRNKRR